jgi:hypothetical protein
MKVWDLQKFSGESEVKHGLGHSYKKTRMKKYAL